MIIGILWEIFRALILIVGIISAIILGITLILTPIKEKKLEAEMKAQRDEIFELMKNEFVKTMEEIKEENQKKAEKVKKTTKKSKEN